MDIITGKISPVTFNRTFTDFEGGIRDGGDSRLYISDLAEFYYSRVFCACANPVRNGVTANLL